MKIVKLLIFVIFLNISNVSAWEYNGRHGWPVQKSPKGLIVCDLSSDIAETMLIESLSGLAAQAVNEGDFDKMLWIDVNNNPSYKNIYDSSITTLGITDIEKMDVWEIVKYLKKEKVVKGYVLYTKDKAHKNAYLSNPGTNYSSNVATVYASLLKGVLIDESLVAKAKECGLKELKDARFETPRECFEKNKDKLNNHSALSIPPCVHHLRDYAIAHKLMLYADRKDIIDDVLEWVKPLSPILGWGCGDEYDFTSVISRWGHYNTATNWCMNLPFISSISSNAELCQAEEIELSQIDFEDNSSFHSFVMSDGDNVQWSMGSYGDSKLYMGNEGCADLGLSWTLCPTALSIVSPFTWNNMAQKQSPKASLIEYGGGYQYPDVFAVNRANRPELLREFARRINYHLHEMDIKIFGFLCWNVASAEAQEAFQIYAEEMPDITGMIAVQYFPYELEGEIYWPKNREGYDIPVVTSRYSLWNEVNESRPRAGTPEYIASVINRDVMALKAKDDSALSWTIVHAWSNFDESSTITPTPGIGFNPVKATNDMLLDDIKVVSTNELLWRIRMKYRPEQTEKLLTK